MSDICSCIELVWFVSIPNYVYGKTLFKVLSKLMSHVFRLVLGFCSHFERIVICYFFYCFNHFYCKFCCSYVIFQHDSNISNDRNIALLGRDSESKCSWQVKNYIVRSYRDVIVVTSIVTRTTNKA